ncbi:uncharacterized protein METZ01_LOCUS110324 [marine metagenome]|uniref:Uncharacterized protein n=1 Tax=marine metagenome TaxID=408172 RepID=A0A381WYF9_9ZZZZ|tara:strand:+ start:3562 stop:3834 length:273 start_codon:yes stop_codon:yes gene_type:complete
MGNSFSTCNDDCIVYDTFEHDLRDIRLKNDNNKQRDMKLSKKNFYNIRDEKQTNIVKIKNLKSKTQNTQESHVIKHIDEIINYLEKIPSN